MNIKARRHNKYFYPPVGNYISPPPILNKFSNYQIKDHNFNPGVRLKLKGVRQSTVEATILGNIRAIDQNRVPINYDWLTSAWR